MKTLPLPIWQSPLTRHLGRDAHQFPKPTLLEVHLNRPGMRVPRSKIRTALFASLQVDTRAHRLQAECTEPLVVWVDTKTFLLYLASTKLGLDAVSLEHPWHPHDHGHQLVHHIPRLSPPLYPLCPFPITPACLINHDFLHGLHHALRLLQDQLREREVMVQRSPHVHDPRPLHISLPHL